MTFETFVVTPRNRFAYAMALAVAEEPGKAYNPLIVYGESGAGKTHLLNAIAGAAEVAGEVNVRLMSASELVEAVDRNQASLTDVDVLLIDDLDDADDLAAVYETLTVLLGCGRQVVVVAHPDGDTINELRSLAAGYEWGIAADCELAGPIVSAIL